MAHIRRHRILALLLLLLAISTLLWPKGGAAQGGKAKVTQGRLPAGWQGQQCDPGWAECLLVLQIRDRAKGEARLTVTDLTNAPHTSAQPSDKPLPQDGFTVGIPIFLRQFNSVEELRSHLSVLFPGSQVISSPTVKIGGYDAYNVTVESKMGQYTIRDDYYWVNVPGTPVGIVSTRDESLKGESDIVLKSLCFDAKCGASSSVPPTPTPSPCTPTVRGFNPQKPGDVISPGATYRDANGKEVGIILEAGHQALPDGTPVMVSFSCLQAGVHDLLCLEYAQDHLHLETVSSSMLLERLFFFVSTPDALAKAAAETAQTHLSAAPPPEPEAVAPPPLVAQPAVATCPRCSSPLKPAARFCEQCGAPTAPEPPPAPPACPQCGSPIRAGVKFSAATAV